ncbi:tetratricopeptide repeat protein [Streptomyces erythrochromogenes]|uniref:tetratricopeptide repeat protein n=1 Tax=Streptomyces erythrochromogenes TaxID=285574 RepID=UPI0036786AF2
MQFDRCVQVRLRVHAEPTGKPYCASGYLLAPRLVLTAAHLLDDDFDRERDTVTVYQPTGREFPATVLWLRKDTTVDALLLEIDEGGGWEPPKPLRGAGGPRLRWGRFIGSRCHPVSVVGFPRMQLDPDHGDRWDWQLEGTVRPGTGRLAHRYEVTSSDPTVPLRCPPGATGWSGMSGAPVLAEGAAQEGDLLCGIVRQDRQADSGTILITTPAAELLADAGFREALVRGGAGYPVLEPAEPVQLLAPARPRLNRHSPAGLLSADAAVVAFEGRETETARLLAWSGDGPDGLSIHVLTGPGGQGKTRLAGHVADLLREDGWTTGFLRSAGLSDDDSTALAHLKSLDTEDDLFLVVDYAETRPRVLRRIVGHLSAAGSRVRLLLLARSDGAWRKDALSAEPEPRTLLNKAGVTPLTPLVAATRAHRTAAVGRAVADLAVALPQVEGLPPADWPALARRLQSAVDLADDRFASALALQMYALTLLLQNGPSPVPATEGMTAEDVLLLHEGRFWEGSATSPDFRLTCGTTDLGKAVAAASLCGASNREEAVATVGRLAAGLEEPCPPAGTARWLNFLYPPAKNQYWGSLQPDRLAEHHISETLTGEDGPLPALLAGASPGQQARFVTVLARAAVAHYNAHRHEACDRILRDIGRALDAAPCHFDALANAAAALPHPSRVVAPLAVRLESELIAIYRRAANPSSVASDLAFSLSRLSARLGETGARAEALSAETEALALRQRLAVADPDRYAPDLAASLSSLGVRMADLGRWREALDAETAAVDLRRRLVAFDPAVHEADLSGSLVNLTRILVNMGRWDDSLRPAGEAVEIWRRLAGEDPVAHSAALAKALSNLGVSLQGTKRSQEALQAESEAVEIWRRLAAADLAAHEADLALSLSNLAPRLVDADRPEEGIRVGREAVAIRRKLADRDAAAHRAALAGSLSNLGVFLRGAGAVEEAVDVGREAVEIMRPLADADPVAHQADHASYLGNLSRSLDAAGHDAEALALARRAVQTLRRLADQDLTAHGLSLSKALTGLDMLLERAGRAREALEALQEAVDVLRRLAGRDPATHASDFAALLIGLSERLAGRGGSREAIAAAEEAVESIRPEALRRPQAHALVLALSLSELDRHLMAAGQEQRALPVAEESMRVWQRLAQADPASYGFLFATGLTGLAVRLAMAGQPAGALSAGRHVAAVLHRRPPAHGVGERAHLRAGLVLLADVCDRLGRSPDAALVRRWIAGDLGTTPP